METKHQVSLLVTEPLAAVDQRLRQVEDWADFLIDVSRIHKVSHERYSFQILSGNHTRDALVAVREHPRESFYAWNVLSGPCFDGTIRLVPAEGGWTAVTVTLRSWPDGLLAGLTDMMPGRDRPGIDEGALRRLVSPSTAGDGTSAGSTPTPTQEPSS